MVALIGATLILSVESFFRLQLDLFYLVSYVGHNPFQANVSKLTEDL